VSDAADVVVVGAGIVGLSLAYELSDLGASVTVVDAGHTGRATDAGAGILSPVTNREDDPALWPFLRQCGAHYPSLLDRLAADGAPVQEAGFGVCGLLSVTLHPHENEWFAPFAKMAMRRSPGSVAEIGVADAVSLFPPLGRVHRVLHAPGAARVDGRGMAAALRAATRARGVAFLEGRAEGVVTGDGPAGVRQVSAVRVDNREVPCGVLAVTGGAWSAAMGEWLDCALPVGPTKGQIVHLGVEGDTAAWPIVQPLLTHYLVPWPGGRVVCGGTFESGAGFSTAVTAAGISELLREGLSVAPGLAEAEYRETRVGLRPTSADDRALVGLLPGWGNAWVATGHGANGLLQGPYSGRVLAHAVAGRDLPAGEVPAPAAFNPARVRGG
jgi:D-amino-acid dehydrogenase